MSKTIKSKTDYIEVELNEEKPSKLAIGLAESRFKFYGMIVLLNFLTGALSSYSLEPTIFNLFSGVIMFVFSLMMLVDLWTLKEKITPENKSRTRR